MILSRAKGYYGYDKGRLENHARDKYGKFSEEEENKKRGYGKNRYHNMSDEIISLKSLNIIMNQIVFLL